MRGIGLPLIVPHFLTSLGFAKATWGECLMRFIAIVIACALCLAGCADYQARQQAEAAAQARQIAANDDARCQSYGAKPGSDAYVSCRMNIITSERLRITPIARSSGSIC